MLDRAKEELVDSQFAAISKFLIGGDCLVLNNTRVLPARFYARRKSGAKLGGLFLGQPADGLWEVLLKGAGKVRTGETIELEHTAGRCFCNAVIVEKMERGRCRMRIDSDGRAEEILEKIGFAPLPPYIKRDDDPEQAQVDKVRYQTVYAKHFGAVAAPTAGLHFTPELIERLKKAGIRFAYVTLHTGPGTFLPINTEIVGDFKIHAEQFSVTEANANIINAAKAAGARIIAVGTTSVRVIETVASGSKVSTGGGMTDLFIMPGYKFKIVDGMVTNFHLPRSSLLALVAAFAGLETTLSAYKHAVERRYRFYSYGDAMLIV